MGVVVTSRRWVGHWLHIRESCNAFSEDLLPVLIACNMSFDGDQDLEIIFHNKTSEDDIVLMVFARNYPAPLSEEILKMAWKLQLVTSMSNFRFFYPRTNHVCVSYTADGNRVSSKRTMAKPGSILNTEVSRNGVINLHQEDSTLPPSTNFITGFLVRNLNPTNNDWTGRAINVSLYKGENSKRPLVSKQCSVNSYVTLTDTRYLYFGVMIPAYSIAYEYHFKSSSIHKRRYSYENIEFTNHDLTLIPDAEFSPLSRINLEDFVEKGFLEVVLTEDEISGKFTFTASNERK